MGTKIEVMMVTYISIILNLYLFLNLWLINLHHASNFCFNKMSPIRNIKYYYVYSPNPFPSLTLVKQIIIRDRMLP